MTSKDDTRVTPWIKARLSGGNGGDCVELRQNGLDVNVRDSKNPNGHVLAATPEQFTAWIAAARRGEFTPGA